MQNITLFLLNVITPSTYTIELPNYKQNLIYVRYNLHEDNWKANLRLSTNKVEAHGRMATNKNTKALRAETYESQIPSQILASPAFYTSLSSATYQAKFCIALNLQIFPSRLKT